MHKRQVGRILVMTADEGKHFIKVATQETMGKELWLGNGDSSSNYEEVSDVITKHGDVVLDETN